MSCETQKKSLFESLQKEFNEMIEWRCTAICFFVKLMEQIISARNSTSATERRKIYELGGKVEAHTISLINEESLRLVKEWNSGFKSNPRSLIFERDDYKESAKNAPTAKIRQAFKSAVKAVQEALDQASEDYANYCIGRIENSITYAEEIFANEDNEERDLFIAENHLRTAEVHLNEFRGRNYKRKLGHLWYVGLPRVAEKRGMSAEDLYNELWQKVSDAWQSFASLWLIAEEEKRIQAEMTEAERIRLAEIEAEKRCQEHSKIMATRRRAEIENIVRGVERRNPQAGKVARQFLEHIKLGNVGAAWSCIGTITRLDGGVDPVLQEEYRRIAANQ